MMNEQPAVDFTELVAQAQEQLANIAAIQRQQAALTATASAADGMVQVSVNARGVVIETRIDHDYLGEYDVKDLGHDITDAAQQAAADRTPSVGTDGTANRAPRGSSVPVGDHQQRNGSAPAISSAAVSFVDKQDKPSGPHSRAKVAGRGVPFPVSYRVSRIHTVGRQ
jgi:DNA-binding protein YbaB